MATLKQQLTDDMKNAMRSQDKARLGAVRLILAAVKQVEVDQRIDVDDQTLLSILDKLAKQRRESIKEYQKANRQDLVDQEQFELEIIQQYLPEPMTDEQANQLIQQAISESGASEMKDMGKVMAILKPKVQGRVDMGQLSGKVKQLLS